VSLSPRAIATLGVGFGALSVAYVGLWPVSTPVDPPIPPTPPAMSAYVDASPALIASAAQDDQDLLDIMPILIEVLHRGR
jgi:hypothetical protein